MTIIFGIAIYKRSDGFGLILEDDFDATSALELIDAIRKLREEVVRVGIFSPDGLKVHSFGLHVFQGFMSSPTGPQSAEVPLNAEA